MRYSQIWPMTTETAPRLKLEGVEDLEEDSGTRKGRHQTHLRIGIDLPTGDAAGDDRAPKHEQRVGEVLLLAAVDVTQGLNSASCSGLSSGVTALCACGVRWRLSETM